jgi:hypothetical protein
MNFDEIPRAGSVSLRSGHAWRGTLRRLHFQQIDGSLVERPATSRMRSAEANFGGSCEIVLRRSSRLPIVFVGAFRARPSIRQSSIDRQLGYAAFTRVNRDARLSRSVCCFACHIHPPLQKEIVCLTRIRAHRCKRRLAFPEATFINVLAARPALSSQSPASLLDS